MVISKKLIALVCFVLTGFGFTQSFYYTGIMGDGLAIQMELAFNGGQITGHYYYDAVGTPIRLEGSLDDTVVRLEEYVDTTDGTQLTGTFSGELLSSPESFATNLTGEWLNPYGNVFSFSLEKVAEYVDIDITQGRIETKSSYPYFSQAYAAILNTFSQDDFMQRQISFLREGQNLLDANELYNGWVLDGSTRIAYFSKDFISLEEGFYLYTGGAHGNLALSSYNFSLTDNDLRILELRDMFAARSDFMAILEPFVLGDLRQQEAQWVLDESVASLTEQDLSIFTVSPEGLAFQFEPYLMGPFVQGSFEVLVPFEALLAVIDDRSPLYRFVQ